MSDVSADAPAVRLRGINHGFGTGELRKPVLTDVELDLMPG